MCSIDLTTPNCDLHLLNFPSQSRQTTLLTKKEKIPFCLNREPCGTECINSSKIKLNSSYNLNHVLCYWSTNLHTSEWISISISKCTIQNSSSSTFGLLNINLIPGICDWPLFVNSHSTLELWTVYVHVKLVCKGEFDLKVARKWNQNTTVLDQTCHPSRCHMWKFCGGNGISLY